MSIKILGYTVPNSASDREARLDSETGYSEKDEPLLEALGYLRKEVKTVKGKNGKNVKRVTFVPILKTAEGKDFTRDEMLEFFDHLLNLAKPRYPMPALMHRLLEDKRCKLREAIHSMGTAPATRSYERLLVAEIDAMLREDARVGREIVGCEDIPKKLEIIDAGIQTVQVELNKLQEKVKRNASVQTNNTKNSMKPLVNSELNDKIKELNELIAKMRNEQEQLQKELQELHTKSAEEEMAKADALREIQEKQKQITKLQSELERVQHNATVAQVLPVVVSAVAEAPKMAEAPIAPVLVPAGVTEAPVVVPAVAEAPAVVTEAPAVVTEAPAVVTEAPVVVPAVAAPEPLQPEARQQESDLQAPTILPAVVPAVETVVEPEVAAQSVHQDKPKFNLGNVLNIYNEPPLSEEIANATYQLFTSLKSSVNPQAKFSPISKKNSEKKRNELKEEFDRIWKPLIREVYSETPDIGKIKQYILTIRNETYVESYVNTLKISPNVFKSDYNLNAPTLLNDIQNMFAQFNSKYKSLSSKQSRPGLLYNTGVKVHSNISKSLLSTQLSELLLNTSVPFKDNDKKQKYERQTAELLTIFTNLDKITKQLNKEQYEKIIDDLNKINYSNLFYYLSVENANELIKILVETINRLPVDQLIKNQSRSSASSLIDNIKRIYEAKLKLANILTQEAMQAKTQKGGSTKTRRKHRQSRRHQHRKTYRRRK